MVSGEEHPEERTPEERTAPPKQADALKEHGGDGAGGSRRALAAPEGLWPHAG